MFTPYHYGIDTFDENMYSQVSVFPFIGLHLTIMELIHARMNFKCQFTPYHYGIDTNKFEHTAPMQHDVPFTPYHYGIQASSSSISSIED